MFSLFKSVFPFGACLVFSCCMKSEKSNTSKKQVPETKLEIDNNSAEL